MHTHRRCTLVCLTHRQRARVRSYPRFTTCCAWARGAQVTARRARAIRTDGISPLGSRSVTRSPANESRGRCAPRAALVIALSALAKSESRRACRADRSSAEECRTVIEHSEDARTVSGDRAFSTKVGIVENVFESSPRILHLSIDECREYTGEGRNGKEAGNC